MSDRLSAFRHKGFAAFWMANILTGLALQMQTVAIGWQVYDLTRDPFNLGLVGLTQFMPALLLVLVTGSAADRYSRRMILALAAAVKAICAGLFLLLALRGAADVWPMFAILVLFGAARAFHNPARQSFLPNIVGAEDLSSAIALTTTSNQAAIIIGPLLGGLLYGLAPGAAYGSTACFLLIAVVLYLTVPSAGRAIGAQSKSWATLLGGIAYIRRTPVVLGAISLDLFAVLLGGATALLPVFARDILDVGPTGLGLLRSATAMGAIAVGVLLVIRPIQDRAGWIMIATVVLFGLATAVFAFSTTLWLSVVALFVMGGADMVSVNIRQILVQLWTPDDLRGRVTSVNAVFIGASNEVGGFRAGTMAALIGPVGAVGIGAAGILAVTALWVRLFPQLRDVRELNIERAR